MGRRHDAVAIVCSADAGYVLPLTVMLWSVRTHLPAHRPLDIHVIDEGIPEGDKARLRRSFEGDAVTISSHTADRSRLVGVPLWGRLPICVYNKLLVPDVLPDDVDTAAHFSGNLKPWRHDSGNPYYTLYYEYIDRTVFAWFRPRRHWHTAALRSYEQAAFRRMLLPSEQWGIKAWRVLTGRIATPADVGMMR